MFDIVHYVIGGAAGGSLRALCKGRSADCVVELLDPLSIGPLSDIDTPGGIRERKHYLQRLFERIAEPQLYAGLEPGIGLPEFGAAQPDAARAFVWCGPNADEQIMLRAACAGWRSRPLHVVDVGANDCGVVMHRAVGACTPDELRIAESGAQLLPASTRAVHAADWKRLLRSRQTLRVFERDQLVGCDDDLFDAWLLAACSSDFCSAARVVGQVLGASPHLIQDTFLDDRLRELIARGDIEADDASARLAAMRVRRRHPAP